MAVAPLAEMPLDRVKNIFDTNVFAVLRTVRAVFPHMASRKRGVIVNVGSTAGDMYVRTNFQSSQLIN